MYLKLKAEYETAMRNSGKVFFSGPSAVRLFAPGDSFLTQSGLEVYNPGHWHIGITEKFIKNGVTGERLYPDLLVSYPTKEEAIDAIFRHGFESRLTIAQTLCLRFQGPDAPLEIMSPR